jgi:hypothetical protein
MASPISKADTSGDWQGRVVAHADFAKRLAARREAIGELDMPRNSGNRRTPSKRALLKALDQLGADW